MALQHLRSSTAHKRPIPTVMSAGQIAINTNEASPALFFKDSNGDLVKVGPVHVGTSAPNSSPASVAATALVTGTVYQILTVGDSDFTLVGAASNTVGTIFTATGTTTGTGTVSGQQGVEKGEMWLDTTGGTYVLKIYDGTDWRSESGTFVDVSGDTMTGDLVFNNADIIFEGATANDFETTLTVTDPTADRTITLPDVTGTVVTTGDTGSVTSTMILDGTIVNADVNASAAIAGTKIDPDFGSQTIETTGVFSAAGGAAATPSITFTGDLNTGIYSPGSDQLALATSGTQRLLIEADGDINIDSGGVFYDATNNRLAIGTTGPNEILEIKKDSPDPFNTIQTHLKLTNGGGNAGAGNRIVFATGATQALIQAKVNGGNSNSGTDLEFYTHSTTGTPTTPRLIIDSNGRLLVGTSSSTNSNALLKVQGYAGNASAEGQIAIACGATNPLSFIGALLFTDSNDRAGAYVAGVRDGGTWTSGSSHPTRLEFSTCASGSSSPTERMRISSTGAVAINSPAASNTPLNVKSFTVNSGIAEFYHHSNNTSVGTITTTTTATAYNTSSDYRLKENVVPLTGAIDRVNQLQVHRFNFIADPSKIVDGFLAHEAQTVVPECVTGEKDAVDDEGNPVYQGIDQSKLVPLLTAALQEALAEIESLKARVTALEP